MMTTATKKKSSRKASSAIVAPQPAASDVQQAIHEVQAAIAEVEAVLEQAPPTPVADSPVVDTRSRVLNVGGNSKLIEIPAQYAGWNHLLLDIAPGPDVDVQMDARNLSGYDGAKFDSIYSSHNLEHFYAHDVAKVLAGFMHALKAEGFVDITVPDMTTVLKAVVTQGMELDDMLYMSPAGPITAHDVIYGWGAQIERSGVDFFAHKRGFSVKSLSLALQRAGFVHVMTGVTGFNLRAVAFKGEPTAEHRRALGI